MYHVHSYLSISQRPNVVTGNSSVSVFPTFSSLYTNCVCLKNVRKTHYFFKSSLIFWKWCDIIMSLSKNTWLCLLSEIIENKNIKRKESRSIFNNSISCFGEGKTFTVSLLCLGYFMLLTSGRKVLIPSLIDEETEV